MKKQRIYWIGITLIAVAIGFGFYVFYAQPGQFIYYTVATLLIVFSLLWLGNYFLSIQFNKRYPWLDYGKKRFFLQLVVGIFYSIGVINLAYYLVKTLLTNVPPTIEQLIVSNVYGAILFIPSYSIYFSLHFLNHWQQSQLEVERFQKESMRSQLASLKNHLDPHFLFNNLNILSSLIDKSQDQSQRFLGRFAEVYRTMLLTKVEDLITVREEMEFIAAYMFLIQTRFEENIQFESTLDDEVLDFMLPPLTVQMLIENAIKHNNITLSRPLKIAVYQKDNYLIVENGLFEKPEDHRTRSGTGLKNIQARYQYYTDKPVIIEKQKDTFYAGLPLIEIETI